MDKKPVDSTQQQKLSSKERRRFVVFIIESPSCDDFYNDICEGEILKKILHLSGLKTRYKLAANKELFERAITEGIKPYLNRKKGWFPPIIHISGHGNELGMGFTVDKGYLSWDELRDLIYPINEKLESNLILCLSLCKGANACIMAMKKDKVPFHALVSNTGAPLWGDTAIAFATFYHQLARGNTFREAEKAMQTASGDTKFQLFFGEDIKEYYDEVYLERIKKLPQNSSYRKL